MFAQIFWHTCDVVLLDIIQNLTYNTAAVAAVVSSQNKCRLCLAFEGGLPIICLPSQRKTLADSDKDPTTKDQACKPRRHDRENSVVTLLSGETSVSPTIFKNKRKNIHCKWIMTKVFKLNNFSSCIMPLHIWGDNTSYVTCWMDDNNSGVYDCDNVISQLGSLINWWMITTVRVDTH